MNELAYQGTPAALLDDVAELMWLLRVQAEIGERYALVGDSAGLAYITRNMVAYLKSAIPSVNALQPPAADVRSDA